MVRLAIFGGSKVDGRTLRPGEEVFGLALFGGLELDLTDAPAEIGVTIVAIFGGAKVTVRPDADVALSGFGLFGGRNLEPRRRSSGASVQEPRRPTDDGEALPTEIAAYCLFGGVNVKRNQPDA